MIGGFAGKINAGVSPVSGLRTARAGSVGAAGRLLIEAGNREHDALPT